MKIAILILLVLFVGLCIAMIIAFMKACKTLRESGYLPMLGIYMPKDILKEIVESQDRKYES